MEENEKYYSEDELLRGWMLSSLLNFTCYSYYQGSGGKQFVIGDHHRQIARLLDKVLGGEVKKAIINIAPRYGKTVLAVHNFIAAGLAMNPSAQFIHLSYSTNLALENSYMIKKIANSDWYRRVFRFDSGVNFDKMGRWDTSAGGGVYANSAMGQITGFGAGGSERGPEGEFRFGGAIVIDDPIKPDDAMNDDLREGINRHFETTIRNRINSRDTPIVIIMQRLHERDLCGYLESIEPGEWTVLRIPCLTVGEDGKEKALWEYRHTVEELHQLRNISQYVFDTQYQQDPRPLEGLMYESLRTYEELPLQGLRKNYTDTADTGADFLCSICYLETKTGMYVTDVLYTDRPMEYTEEATAMMLLRERTRIVRIESNNGGRGFCRNVERRVRLDNSDTGRQMRFVPFVQTKNKKVRIFSHSGEVQNLVFFPQDWQMRWPQFAAAVRSYRKAGRNAHDDAPDSLTGMAEYFHKDSVASGMEIRLFRNNRDHW